nr:hypothetical protein [Saprospiraceae bacterium]
MMQLYRVILTIFCSLVVSGLYAQPYAPYNDLCDADSDPVPYGLMDESQTLMGDIINNAFITDLAGGDIQDFGVAGADSSAFYKLNFDENASFIEITWIDGSLDNLSAALFSVTDPCGGGGTDYGEMLYQDADGNDLLEADLTTSGTVTFELCNLDPADYDNIYLWLASSEVGDFEITVMQRIRPENNECDFTPEDLGEITPGGTISRINESNQWACRNNLTGSMCLTNAHDGAGVWYEFNTDDVVEMIDLLVEHDNDGPLDVAILELNPDCNNFTIVSCQNVTDGEAEFIELAVKRNTTYHIFINTPQADWGDFDITLSACDPPPNFSLCDHEAVDFPGLAHDPDDPIPGSPFD